MLRLIAAPWEGADAIKLQFLDQLLCAIEQHKTVNCPLRGYAIVSGMRCFLLAPWNCKPNNSHLRFATVLVQWAEKGHDCLTATDYRGNVFGEGKVSMNLISNAYSFNKFYLKIYLMTDLK